MTQVLCPKCVGAKTIMTPREKRGFHYTVCSLCNGAGFVNSELAEDFELSLNEDRLDTEEELY